MNLQTLTIEVTEREGDRATLRLAGELDVYTAPQLKQELVSLADQDVRQLHVDLSQVQYLDSTGLGVLIGGLKRLRENGGNLIVVAPSQRIARIFEITGLDKIFDITEAEAADQ